ncbi:MAG TPA: hypothetical protein VKX46_04665, partial [Ktedonobacteraceae bacterium]|nr:hypothetical protein [Ktedonobacteraceae bacterium]
PEHEHIRLYELLGDNLGWTIGGVEAYQKALAGWRQHKVQDPLTGARLLRKILICYTRGSCYETLGTEYLQGWRAEARQLVEQSGDEEELWRLRVVDLFAKRILRKGPSYEELRNVGQAAVSYFEQRSNWLAVSEALDGFAGISFEMGAFTDALAASQRRLAIPHLSALEYGDALHMAAYGYANLEEYDRCIALVGNELDRLRPGQPVLHMAMAFADASFIACCTGQWKIMDTCMRRADMLQIEMQYDAPYFYPYYLAALSIASAREDQATYDAFLARIQQVMQRYLKPDLQIFLHALCTGDLQTARQVELHKMSYSGLYLLFLCNEEGVVLVPECLDASLSGREDQDSSGKTLTAFRWAYEIARALAADDNTWLACAIDQAEQHQLIVHAARMRILLAQRSGDDTQLERARPVLERLQDRRSLRKLQEVERALGQRL